MNGHTPNRDLALSSGWMVSRLGGTETLAMDFPGDMHSALLSAGLIQDPYWRDTEVSLDWVHESDWEAVRHFDLPGPVSGRHILSLDAVDCHAVIDLNGQEVGRLGNRFRRHDLDVSGALIAGRNRLVIRFLSNSGMAKALAKDFPFPVPYIQWNNRLPHYNFLRKPQCDAGWDWDIALSPLGVYGDIVLRRPDPVLLKDYTVSQKHENGGVRVSVRLHSQCNEPVQTIAALRLDGQKVTREVTLISPT